jgi:glucosamine--fructose-6-phosphate aminotransferase (isomerizing)
MCGIIGVTGSADPMRIIIDGLTMLEYRGYDSAGVALVGDEKDPMWRQRAAVRAQSIAELGKAVSGMPAGATAGIGHTRWATHGAPTEHNAHPHLDCTGRVAIVHNGIIENHREIWANLAAKGHERSSETDSEVIAHLVEDELATGAGPLEAVRRCLSGLRGDFALAVAFAEYPDTLVATRRTSPLIVGRTDTLGIIGSDIAALLPTTRELFVIDDDQVAEVRPGSIKVITADGAEVVPAPLNVTWDVAAARLEGYADFMSKEIHEQPRALADTLLGRFVTDGESLTELEELALTPHDLRSIDRVVVVACGSSFHAGLVGRMSFEAWAKLPATAEIASEFRYREPVIDDRTLVIAISQSGETVDTFHALREAKRRGARTIVLTNVVDSLMAREADGVLYTRAGPEIGVASTKCHLSQLVLLQVFALHLAGLRGSLPTDDLAELVKAMHKLPDAVSVAVGRFDEYLKVADRLAGVNDVYFLGRNSGYPVALEGALKLKELAYVRAEAYPAGEMKHGPISLIEPGAVAVVVANHGRLWPKLMANVEEVRARGATVVAVCDDDDRETPTLVDLTLAVPALPDALSATACVVPLQVLAYGVARARGNDVDRPRNLAKVVTVE